jgi:hypothetical protein
MMIFRCARSRAVVEVLTDSVEYSAVSDPMLRLMSIASTEHDAPMTKNSPDLGRLVFPKFVRKHDCGVHGRFGLLPELHAGLMQEFVAFLTVATGASGHDVVPGMLSAFGARQYVVEGELFSATAVLTLVAVALEYAPTVHWRHFPMPSVVADRQSDVLWYL